MRVLFYYRGAEHFGVQSLISYVQDKGHVAELIYDPALGDNGYLDIPVVNRFLNNLFINDKIVIEKAVRFKPDLIAFSAITNLYLPITRLAKKLKKVLDVPIIIGGIHPTSLPDETIKEDCYDMVCLGEGEGPLAEVLQRLEEKQPYTDIKNLWVKDKSGKVHKNSRRALIKPLDVLRAGDKTLFDKYGAQTSRANIMTTRGCPYECTFCVNSFRNGLYTGEMYIRQRSVPHVIEQLIHLKKTYRPKAVRFHDDVFGYNVKWLTEFRDAYRKHINLPFHCCVTPATAKDNVVKLLSEAGCAKVTMGVQSGSEHIRTKLLNRKHSDKDIIAAAQRLKKYGIKLIAEYIFGFPEETPEDMWKSLDLNDQLDAYNTSSFIFYPYPKTELAEYCLKKGYLSKENYELVKQGHGSYHTSGWLDLPYIDDVYKFSKILPVYNVTPKFLKPLLRKILKLKYGFIHKFIAVIAIPCIDFEEFITRVIEMPRMFMRTKRALKNDDWDKSTRNITTEVQPPQNLQTEAGQSAESYNGNKVKPIVIKKSATWRPRIDASYESTKS